MQENLPEAHVALIETFYTAFAARDAAKMATCYAPDCVFSDAVFRDLKGDEVTGMWHMLIERGADLKVVFSDIKGDERGGSAHWDATYTFSVTGREVINRIDARFEIQNGKIVRHEDQFDLWAWTKMALGPVGWLLGWSPLVQGPLRRRAKGELLRYVAKRREETDN